jgi:hypothetical protein
MKAADSSHEVSMKNPLLIASYDEKNAPQSQDASFFELFEMKSPLDFVLMFFGFIAAIITGGNTIKCYDLLQLM